MHENCYTYKTINLGGLYEIFIENCIFKLVGTLLISPSIVHASTVTPNAIQNINLGDGLEVTIEDSSEKRIAIYYENDIKKQKAILYKKSGEIYYYDLNPQNTLSSNYSTNNNISPQSYTKKYNIEDFNQSISVNDMKIMDNAITAQISSLSSAYLKSKIYTDGGETYKRYLYGYTGEEQYQQNSWHFAAGIKLTVVLAVVGFIPGIGALIISTVGAAGGIILSALTVNEWIKDFYWVYIFDQTSPEKWNFTCKNHFTYQKQRRVEINGDTGYWETYFTESDFVIESTREDILSRPILFQ